MEMSLNLKHFLSIMYTMSSIFLEYLYFSKEYLDCEEKKLIEFQIIKNTLALDKIIKHASYITVVGLKKK